MPLFKIEKCNEVAEEKTISIIKPMYCSKGFQETILLDTYLPLNAFEVLQLQQTYLETQQIE